MDLLEIRTMIFKVVINGYRTPASSPSKSNMIHISDTPYTEGWRHGSYYEKRDIHSPSNSLPLLLTSRQVSVETQWILNRMKDMFSTWVSVPQLTSHLSTLHIDVRLFGRMATRNEVRPYAAHDFNRLNCYFYAILNRFLLYGPVGEKKGGSGNSYEDRVITVENLVIDFHSAKRNLPSPTPA